MIAGRTPSLALGPLLVALGLAGGPFPGSPPAAAAEAAPASPAGKVGGSKNKKEGGAEIPWKTLIEIFNSTKGDFAAFWDMESGEAIGLWTGGVEGTFGWEGARVEGTKGKVEPVHLMADRVLAITAFRLPRKGAGGKAGQPGESGGEEKEKKEKKEEEKKEAENEKEKEKDKAPRIAPPRLYAEGNVRIETRNVVIETDAFYFDAGQKRGVLVGARGHGELGALNQLAATVQRRDFLQLREPGARGVEVGGIGGLDRTPATSKVAPGADIYSIPRVLAFRADTLRALDLRHFEGDGVVISNCEYGVPHVGFSTKAARIYPAEEKVGEGSPAADGEEASEDGKERENFIIDARANTMQLGGIPALPLPPMRWNTEWSGSFPIRKIRPGHSGRFGYIADVDWNLNWFIERTPIVRLEPARMFLDDSRLDFVTDYRSSRGLAWGPQGLYGRDPKNWEPWELRPGAWTFHGDAGYYAVHDEGEDRTSDIQFEDEDRYWAHVYHRQEIPHVGILDVEYSEQSDPNFLREWFEPIAKEEKPQESLFYFRRPFRDNMEVTALYKYKTNDFDNTLERLPEGKFFLLEQPVARTGLYGSLAVQAADLRQNPPEPLPEVRSSRFDASNEWAYPFGIGRYVRFRPFADVRFSEFEKGVDEDDPIDRESLGAGITGSQQWSRIYPLGRGGFGERWLGVTALKHEVIPKVTYRNLYYNNVEPEELIPFDEVETVSTDERIELSLRNELIGRGPAPDARPLAGATSREGTGLRKVPGITRSILDAELSTDWFTHPARDNEGKRFSFLDVDLTFRPKDRFALRSRSFFDPTEGMRFEETDTSVTVIPAANVLSVRVGERFRRDLTTWTYTEWSVEFSRRYMGEVYYAYDFQKGEAADLELRITRFFHKWAFEGVYHLDFNQDNEHSFSVNLQPLELLGEMRRRHEQDRATR